MNLDTLTVHHVFTRAAHYFPDHIIVERIGAGPHRRMTYQTLTERALRLAHALQQLGVKPGDRVATLLWNNSAHLEAYLAIPMIGAICHTLNLRLHPNELAYIVNHAQDRVLLVDASLLPLYEAFRHEVTLEHVIVVGEAAHQANTLSYESMLATATPSLTELVPASASTPAFLLYTSGTTGRPKGVLYTHGQLALAALALTSTITFAVSQDDCILFSVPMFHVAGWALPYAALAVGSTIVLPGPHPQALDLLTLLAEEQGTFAAGVPTVWHDIANLLEQQPHAWHLSPRLRAIIGGSAAPEALIRRLEAFGITVIHGWGMSEVLLGLQSHVKLASLPTEERYAWMVKQGMPAPFVEARVLTFDGHDAPWDGQTLGELLVRGPWIADAYYRDEQPASFVDGWLRTGDIAVIDEQGYVKIVDRAKDLIKSGGEWISTIALEDALLKHPAVAEAAVIGIPHERWQERPLALVVLRPGHSVTADELRAYLQNYVVRWWIPDAIVFVSEIPKTSTGKLAKMVLREQYRDWKWEERT